MKNKVLLSVGGTGGHIYPAIALAQALTKHNPCIELLFAGGNLSTNRFFDQTALPYRNISCGPLSTRNLVKSIFNAGNIIKGVWESKKIFREFKPDLVIGFGSYHTFPTMLAAKICHIPMMLHASDSIPGKVIRFFSRFAITTTIQFPESALWLRGKSIEVNVPLRSGFRKEMHSMEYCRSYFKLKETCPTLLIFGGSQGAAFINEITAAAIIENSRFFTNNLQIIHLTGCPKTAALLQRKYQEAGIYACVKDFETKMELAWQAASLIVSRAGATTIAEQLEFEIPGILIPYPHAADRHQEKNALFMEQHIGAVKMALESKLDKHLLAEYLQSFLENENFNLQEKQEAIRSYKKNHKPKDLCSLVLEQLDKEYPK
jgi:UDP-N-acetylglucosamine--N-acetylmuramyl-(pentapeptide) pyrophosphoryl-undecaprenol N-acetylglucosamine transferase